MACRSLNPISEKRWGFLVIIDKKRIILENGFRIWVKIKAKVSTGKTEEFGS
jgi:hypothetical protein